MQPVAIGGKSASRGNRKNKANPLPPAATGCLRRSMVSRASAVGCHPLREVPSLRRSGSTSCCFGEGYLLLLQSGHGHWSQPQPVHALLIMDRFYSATDLPAGVRVAKCEPLARGRRLAEFAAAVAAPGFATLLDRDRGDDQRCCRIHPPESEQRVHEPTALSGTFASSAG